MKKLTIDFRMSDSSGIGVYIRSILPGLSDKFDVTLLANKKVKGYKTIIVNAKVYSIKEQLIIPLRLKKTDIFWTPHYNVPILNVRAKRRVVTIHDVCHLAFSSNLSKLQYIYAKFLIAMAVKRSDIILTDSQFSKSEIKNYTQTKKPINVVYCGLDKKGRATQESVIDSRLMGKRYLLYVGNIKPHKNIVRAIKAFLNIQSDFPDVYFTIVGRREGLLGVDKALFSEIEGNEKIVFVGHVSDAELIAYYKHSHAFVFPSLYEGFGLPPLEAQNFGIPVVASCAASIKEVCEDSVLYFDPYNVDDIGEKFRLILTDEKLQKSLVAKGSINIERFSWKKAASQIVVLLNQG